MAINLATAYISILPETSKFADGINKVVKSFDSIGESAGKDLGRSMATSTAKALDAGIKGKGKSAGSELGKELDQAMQAAVKGAGVKTGKAVGDELEKSVGSAGKRATDALKNSFVVGAVGGGVAAATSAAIGGLKGLAAEAVTASDATDKFKSTLSFAGLDTGTIDKVTAQAKAYADATVYDLGDIQSMTAQLASNGVKDYSNLAEAAGNLNAVSGGNADTFKSVGMVMTQTAGAGKLTTENWNQLADAIPGASGVLQEAMLKNGAYTGNFRDAMADGQITAEEFNQAVMELGQQDGAKQAAESVSTYEGALGNLQATLVGAMSDGLTAAKPFLTDLINGFNDLAGKVIPLVGAGLRSIPDVVRGVGDAFQTAGTWIADNKNKLLGLATVVSPAVAPVMIGLAAKWTAAGIAATVSAAKQVAAWISTKIEAVKSGAAAVLNLWKVGAGWIKAGVQATIGAAKQVAAWVLVRAQNAGSALLALASLGTGWVKAGIQATVNAAKIAASWVVAMGPIGWAITAIVGIGTALWAFFTKTETGRQLWATFTAALQSAWQGFTTWISSTWTLLTAGFTAAWTIIKSTFFDLWNGAVDAIRSAWEGFTGWISSTWGTITTAFSTGWEAIQGAFFTLWDGAVEGIKTTWETVSGAISSTWEGLKSAFQAGWDFIKSVFITAWQNEVQGLQNIWSAVVGALSAIWEGLKTAFNNGWQFIQNVVFEPFKAAINVVKSVFSGNTDAMRAAFDVFKQAIHNAIAAIKNRLNDMVNGFREIPGKIKAAFAGAGSWLLDAGRSIIQGLADGVRNAGSAVMDAIRSVVPDSVERFVPELHFGGLAGFARGGVLPSIPGVSNSQRDPILGWSTEKKTPIARVEPGEFIVNRAATKQYLPLLAAINGGKLDRRKGDLGLPGYADGGVVGYSDVLKFLHGGNVNGNQAPGSLEGAPYVWGGGLDGNWGDCSGTQSAVAALVAGVDTTGRKFATGSQGSWLAQHGFKRGRSSGKNAFETAYFNGGPWGGHTAGTIFGPKGESTNVEMGGGRGNGQIGGAAAGSRNSQFTDVWWHALKGSTAGGTAASEALVNGKVANTSTTGVTVDTGIKLDTIDWGTASNLKSEWEKDEHKRTQLKKWRANIYDTGGILPTNGIAVNKGKPERVLNSTQTVAFDKFVGLVPGLTSALTKFSSVPWEAMADELTAAWNGSDSGYAGLAEVFGERAGEKIANKIAFLGDVVRDVQDGSNIRAYLSGMDATEGLGLADSVGSLVGITGLKSTFGGVTGAYKDLEDASVAQVDATEAVTQAEKNLISARAQYREMQGKDVELSDKMQRRIKDAEKNLEEVKTTPAAKSDKDGSKKAKRVADAEEKLKRVREDAAKELEKNGSKSAEELLKAQEAVTDAENEYQSSLGAVRLAAEATGRAEVAAAIQVAETVITVTKKIVTWISDKIVAVQQGFATAWSGISNAFGSIAQLAGMVTKLRGEVSKLIVQQMLAQIELAAALRNVRIAQMDGVRSQLEGAVTVAEAQAEFEAQRRADLKASMSNYDDLSLSYDRFRNSLKAGTDEFGASMDSIMADMSTWSDTSRSLWEKVQAAQVGERLLAAQAQQANLEAVWKATVAALDLKDVTAQLGTAAEKLAVASGKAFGMGEGEATAAQRWADLQAEKANIKANQGKNWWRVFSYHASGAGAMDKRRLAQIDQQLRELEQTDEFKSANVNKRDVNKVMSSAGWLGFTGHTDMVEQMIKNSSLGDAARALDEIEYKNKQIDIKANESEMRRQLEKQLAEVDYRTKLNPMNNEITALESEKASHEAWAKYYETQDAGVRAAVEKLANYQADTADQLRQLAAQPDKVLYMTGDAFSAEQVKEMAGNLNARVVQLENKTPLAAEVAYRRR